MNDELSLRASLAVILLLFFAVRIYYTALAARSGNTLSMNQLGRVRGTLMLAVGWVTIILPIVYVVAPDWLTWAVLPLPLAWRWIGVGLGILSVPLLLWAHRSLGKNFAMPGIIQERQTLVTVGPYHWVRHPMYATFAVIGLAYFLVSANWFIGLIDFVVYGMIVLSVLGLEEATLLEKFGEPYREYMQHTGRFLPGL